MLAVARKLCYSDAEDIVQEAMLIAQQHPGDASSTTWLYLVVRRVALSHLRKLARRSAAVIPMETTHPSAEEIWLALEAPVVLRDAITTLSLPLQEAVNLRLKYGRQAAQKSGLSANTFRSRMSRAQQQLKELL